MGGYPLESVDIARAAAEAASEKQASDILLLDVREVCNFSSFFVICTGESDRQLQAIGEEIEATLKKLGVRVMHQEGESDSGWMLYDYGDVVVHIFSPAERQHYEFDELWRKGKPVIHIQ